ncbi:MAG: SycD/LcrH family type III secretion system chaperone [Planctomycetes bacterium]|nr:SycD/LcrH family type III secretion system chaperone [Planctomycetota bacterium]
MSATTTPADEAITVKARELIEHFQNGGTLKSHFRFTDEELEAVYAVAHNQFSARKYAEAIDLFRFLCLYDHTEPRWFYSLGVARQHTGDHAGAVEAYGMATLLDVEDPLPQTQAGYCLLAMERWPEAQNALEGALMACGDDESHADVKRQAESLLATAKAKAAAK